MAVVTSSASIPTEGEYTRRLPLGILGLVLAVSLVIYFIRLEGMVAKGDVYDPLGHQGPPLYSIWKVQNGYPLYEWPDREHFTLTLYNYSFYYVYAWLLNAFGVSGQAIIVGCRIISIFCCLVGVVATFLLIVTNCPSLDRRARWFVAILSIYVWFGTSPMGWWNISIRPDLLALVYSSFGLLAYLHAVRRSAIRWFLLASVLFFCTWSAKQSYIAMLLGVSLHALVCIRRLAPVLAVTLPAALLMAASLLLGTDTYRANLLWAPSISPILVDRDGITKIAKVVSANAFLWLFPVVVLVRDWLGRSRHTQTSMADPEGIGAGLAPLVFTSVVGVLWGSIAVFRAGGEDNALLEGHLSLGVLSTILLICLLARAGASDWAVRVAPLLIGSMLIYPAGQLLFRLAPMRVLSEGEFAQRRALVEYMNQLPKPILVWDDMLSQPWFSNDNRYPTFVPDRFWLGLAAYQNLLREGGINGLMDRKYFGSVILNPQFPGMIKHAEKAGYRPPSAVASLGDEYIVLVRTDDSTAQAK